MLTFTFASRGGSPYRILCLGSHSDDIEIGCGGTLMRLAQAHPDASVHWVVFSAEEDERRREAIESAERILFDVPDRKIVVKGFRASFFPYSGTAIKECFEEIKGEFAPDLIFTHYHKDLHQDHRLIAELTWNTFRDHLILEYEIPKYDGDLGAPNVFVRLDGATCRRKIESLMTCFPSQREKRWFTEDTFLGLMRLRGIESNAPERYAEGFYCRKLVY